MSELELTIEGRPGAVTAQAFLDVARQAVEILRELDRAALEAGVEPTRWVVADLHMGSTVMVLAPAGADALPRALLDRPVYDLVEGVADLQKRPSLPPAFSVTTVRRVGKIGKHIGKQGVDGVSFRSLSEQTHGEVVPLTAQALANAEEAVRVQDQSLGSVTGFLDVMNIRRGRRASLYDTTTRRAVRCRFPEHLLADLRDAFGQEIRAWGTLRRNRMGQPVELVMDGFEPLPTQTPQVAVDAIAGIAPWLANNAVEYIRTVRSA